MHITFINCDGGGFASLLEVTDATSVGQLFDQQLGCLAQHDRACRCRQEIAAD